MPNRTAKINATPNNMLNISSPSIQKYTVKHKHDKNINMNPKTLDNSLSKTKTKPIKNNIAHTHNIMSLKIINAPPND